MPTTEQLDTALAGRYVIARLVGEGGMATVYLVRDLAAVAYDWLGDLRARMAGRQ